MSPTELLADVDLFADLTPGELEQLAAAGAIEDLRRGDVLFHENDAPDKMYVVTSGRVAIAKRSIDGRESVVALMERGDLFGDMAFFEGLGRSAEARALEPSQVLAIPFAPIRRIYESRPELLWGVVAMLAGGVPTLDVGLADSVFLDGAGRPGRGVTRASASFARLGGIERSDRRYRITNREQLERRAR